MMIPSNTSLTKKGNIQLACYIFPSLAIFWFVLIRHLKPLECYLGSQREKKDRGAIIKILILVATLVLPKSMDEQISY